MSFDLEKLQAVAELGEVIRLQNEALDRLRDFRKARPYLIMPNLAKMVEENMKESSQVLYKELNNLHRPAEQQTRYICDDCKMAFLVKLPGGICDECRAKRSSSPREYVVNAPPVDLNASDDDPAQNENTTTDPNKTTTSENASANEVAENQASENSASDESAADENTAAENETAESANETAGAEDVNETAEFDPSDIRAKESDASVVANSEGVPVNDEQSEEIADDAEHAATGDKLPIKEETSVTGAKPADVSGDDSESVTKSDAAAEGNTDADEEMSEEFRKFMDGNK